jgi:hypothetical protein
MPSFILSFFASTFGGLFTGGLSSILGPLVTAAVAVVKGVIDIIIDLLQSFEGRIILALLIAAASCWYVEHRFTYVERSELAALEMKVSQLTKTNAALSRRVGASARGCQ